jgi:hypothetical protein
VTCVVSVSAWRYTHRFTATTVKVSAFVGGVRNSKAFAWPIRVWMVNRLVGSFVVVRRGGLALVISPAKSREFTRELSLHVQEWTGEWPLVS